MRPRRSFFLLEVMIAMLLIGGFSSLSIYGLFRSIQQQKKAMGEIEYTRLVDLHRMNVVAGHWNLVKDLVKKGKSYPVQCIRVDIGKRKFNLDKKLTYQLSASTHKENTDYLLKVVEEYNGSKKTYYYWIKKDPENCKAF